MHVWVHVRVGAHTCMHVSTHTEGKEDLPTFYINSFLGT